MTLTTTQQKSQPTYQPVKNVTAGIFTGALITLTVLIFNTYNPFFIEERNQISGEMSGAVTTVLMFIVSYLVPPGRKEMVVIEDGIIKSAKE